jgi:hypothetical protein
MDRWHARGATSPSTPTNGPPREPDYPQAASPEAAPANPYSTPPAPRSFEVSFNPSTAPVSAPAEVIGQPAGTGDAETTSQLEVQLALTMTTSLTDAIQRNRVWDVFRRIADRVDDGDASHVQLVVRLVLHQERRTILLRPRARPVSIRQSPPSTSARAGAIAGDPCHPSRPVYATRSMWSASLVSASRSLCGLNPTRSRTNLIELAASSALLLADRPRYLRLFGR